ncbi:quinon protein alcohol dehydrogenase-like superfamily [Polychytrium aggregatum]|uniref:quinon protein alcohol dehydrogenase-like superfamily n=1 Tax=Polychytrium aggregatum TaxID=110093 RepID=UPI0022FE21A3|nr:quinon protein alcohol dehydrogenase-like superfamily [Polychytrium aggregatum]KAI9205647.1 quinon protein alcohol dehydrogenase-like superfamily [Polychytrium aggregatum]
MSTSNLGSRALSNSSLSSLPSMGGVSNRRTSGPFPSSTTISSELSLSKSQLSKRGTIGSGMLSKSELAALSNASLRQSGSLHSLYIESSMAADLLSSGRKGGKLGSLGNLTGHTAPREPLVTGMLKPRFSLRTSAEIFIARFSPDEGSLAVGYGDATISIILTSSGSVMRTLTPPGNYLKAPCTTLYFRPTNPSYKNQNILVAGYSEGKIIFWHYTTGQIVKVVDTGDDQVNCITYSLDGARFAMGGSEGTVTVFDGFTSQKAMTLTLGQVNVTSGHSNRIFSVRFHPKEPHSIMSAGWDNTVQIWDTRIQRSVRSIYGPHICADSIDFDDSGDRILTGSYSKENPIQIWSWSQAQVTDTIPWSILELSERKPCLLYAAQFSHSPESSIRNRFVLAAGGGGANEMRIYETQSKRAVAMVQNLTSPVFTAAFSPTDQMVALGGGASKTIYVYDMESQLPKEFLY